jgi:hypothetical protein
MDVEVDRARVVGICLQHAFEDREDLHRAGLRLPVHRPEVPRPKIHERFRGQDRDVLIGGMGFVKRSHRVRVSRIVGGSIHPGRRVISLRERLGHRALERRSALAQGESPLRVPVGFRLRLDAHGQVDVRPEHERRAPPRHGARGVEARGFEERRPASSWLNARKPEPLIEVLLRHRHAS